MIEPIVSGLNERTRDTGCSTEVASSITTALLRRAAFIAVHRAGAPQHQPSDRIGGLVVEGGVDVTVDAEGDGDRGAAEMLLYDPRVVDALIERQCCPGVAEAAESQPR